MLVFYTVTVGWIFSVCLHEFAHAWVAYRGGDHTVAEKGYLTFNPLKYADPLWSFLVPIIILMIGGIGLPGGAVYINRQLLRSRGWDTAVSLAGPAMNLLLVWLISGLFWTRLVPIDAGNSLSCAMAFLLQLQISALILNLLPVPPLDGFQAIGPWLPAGVRERGMAMANIFFMIFFVLLWYVEPLNRLFWDSVYGSCSALGVPPRLGMIGFREFRFWER